MSARAKLVITAILLCVALGLTVFFAVQTVQAFQRFQQEHQLVMKGDVRGIRPWMTVPYIARIYHVPESYLDQSLHITNGKTVHRLSLRDLAPRLKRPLNTLIQDVQRAILNYRKHPDATGTNEYQCGTGTNEYQCGPGAREPGRRPQGSPPSLGPTPASTKITAGGKRP